MADIDCFMYAIRLQESGNNYRAYNKSSTASGAYQFLDSTFHGALRIAGLGNSVYMNKSAWEAPPSVQDAAAHALMSDYYRRFGSWRNVAEAWYGGPGAVGHPNYGGGPGYPNVGQYAAEVLAKMAVCLQQPASSIDAGGIANAIGSAVNALIAPDPVPSDVSASFGYPQWILGGRSIQIVQALQVAYYV